MTFYKGKIHWNYVTYIPMLISKEISEMHLVLWFSVCCISFEVQKTGNLAEKSNLPFLRQWNWSRYLRIKFTLTTFNGNWITVVYFNFFGKISKLILPSRNITLKAQQEEILSQCSINPYVLIEKKKMAVWKWNKDVTNVVRLVRFWNNLY